MLLLLCLGMIAAWPLSRLLSVKQYRPLLLFVCSYGLGMLFWNEPELILDASRYFTQAKHLELSGPVFFLQEWGREIFAWTDMPVLPFIYGVIFRLFGESRLYIQIFTTFCFAMSTVLTCLLGRKLWDEETGFTAGMLMLGMPYLFSQVPLMLVDVPLMFLLLLSVHMFILALERGGLMVPVAALSFCVTFFAKYSAWLMLSEIFVVFGIYVMKADGVSRAKSPARQRALRGVLVFLMSGALISLIWSLKSAVFLAQIKLLRDYQGPGLRRWGESFVSTLLFQIHPGVTLAALFSVWAAFRKWDVKYILVCWLPLLVTAMQIMRIRYVVPVFPLFSLMAAYGLMQIRQGEIRKYIVSGIVLSSVIIAIFAYRPFLNAISLVNLKQAGEFLNVVSGPGAEVFTLYAEDSTAGPAVTVPLLDLFTGKRLVYRDNSGRRNLNSEEVRLSPLRFTWEYGTPFYYAQPGSSFRQKDAEPVIHGRQKGSVVIITGRRDEEIPDALRQITKEYRKMRVFGRDENEFAFKTFVRVYYE
ncbi:MAG: glycosyltransferase family 39 protein [Thermodesulfovibrionales bacterium]